jgi:hypothetical protein
MRPSAESDGCDRQVGWGGVGWGGVENSDGEGMPTISRQWAAIGRLVRGEGDQRPA